MSIPDRDSAASQNHNHTFIGGPQDGREVTRDDWEHLVHRFDMGEGRTAIYIRVDNDFRFSEIQRQEFTAEDWNSAIDREMKRLGMDEDGGAEE